MKQIPPSEFSAAVVKEMENNPQHKLKQELNQKSKDLNTPPIFIKNITDHEIKITSPDYEASILKKDALDYARKTMICETCENHGNDDCEILRSYAINCYTDEPFGCTCWKLKENKNND